jgi:hypothetical protein
MSFFSDIFGGGNSGAVTPSLPAWMQPYMENILTKNQSALEAGDLSKVAGLNTNLSTAIDTGGKAILGKGLEGSTILDAQKSRLEDMAKTGGADELQKALNLDIGVDNANISNQFGGNGVLGSARHQLAADSSADAAKAKYAQQVINNKAAAEQALSGNVGNQMNIATGATSALTNLGNTERGIEQQKDDAVWQGLQRAGSLLFGGAAQNKQSATPGK